MAKSPANVHVPNSSSEIRVKSVSTSVHIFFPSPSLGQNPRSEQEQFGFNYGQKEYFEDLRTVVQQLGYAVYSHDITLENFVQVTKTAQLLCCVLEKKHHCITPNCRLYY